MSVDFMAQWPVEGEQWPEIGADPVNCSNANAAALLEVLGLQFRADELCGECAPADFHARVLTARGLLGLTSDAEGIPATEGLGARGARWVDCGRRPGYLAGKLAELEAVIAEASQHEGGMVVWA